MDVQWEWDGVPVGTGSSHTLTATLGDIGVHNILARASDDSPLGGTVQNAWLVQVLTTDVDGDLWNSNVDCDDAVPGINPDATEIIGNGIDDDCNSATPDSGTPPTSSFITNPLFGEPFVGVNFIDTSTDPDDPIVSYEWDFDNDGIGDAFTAGAVHAFPATGTYPVTLTVVDSVGNSDSVTQDFLVADAPTASFILADGPRVAGFPITFIDTSVDPNGSVISWDWDFGDGETSTQQNPSHIFTEFGIFTVELRTFDDEGAFDSVTGEVNIGQRSVEAGQDRFVDEGTLVEFVLDPFAVPSYVSETNIVRLPRPTFLDSFHGSGHTATIDWDEGSGSEAASVVYSGGIGLITGSHLYPENGIFEVDVCITTPAPDLAQVCDQFTITVQNVAPVTSLFDLTSWAAESYAPVSGFPIGQWNVAADGRSVHQVKNGQPTYFASDFNVFESESSVRMKVSGGDDDMIGFALGFIPGDTTNHNADYILLDWKRGSQTYNFGGNTANCTPGSRAYIGLAVSRVTGIPTADELWGHKNYTRDNSAYNTTTAACLAVEQAGVEELARAATLGSTGWSTALTYEFEFVYTATQLKIWVNDVLQFDIGGTFPDGRLGFYNFSQAGVTYSALGVSAIGAFEGDPVSILGDYQDPGVLDTHTGSMHWADATPIDPLVLTPDIANPGSGALQTPVHVYTDNGTFVTQACVTDDDGGIGCKQVTINVTNLPPVALASGETVPDGTPATVSTTFTDPGSEDVHSAIIDWGDGSDPEELGEVFSPFSLSHTYSGIGTYAVIVTVTDDDGASDIAESEVVVEESEFVNEPPLADAGGPYIVDEGSNTPLDGTASADSDGIISSYLWDLDEDGIFGETGGDAANGDETGATPTFEATDLDGPDSIEVSIRVEDDLGDSTTATSTVTITNFAPTAVLSNDGPVDEGHIANISFGDQVDPSTEDTSAGFLYSYDFGNTGVFDITGSGDSTAAVPASLTTDGPASVDVRGRIEDNDGGITDYVTSVTVNNVAPTAVLSNDGPVDEGQIANVSFGDQVDPSIEDTSAGFLYSYDFGNTSVFDITGSGDSTAAVPASLTTDGPASVDVRGRIEDNDGGFTDYITSVTVNNVAPSPDAGGSYDVDEGSTIGLSGTASDPAPLDDSLTYVWDLDEDGIFGETGIDAANGDETGHSPTFDASGIDGPTSFDVTLRVSDEDGGEAEASTSVQVNNVVPTATAVGDEINEGESASVSGTISDPAPDDTFTVSIDWGDGSSATVLNRPAGSIGYNSSHVYADDNPSITSFDIYSVTVTVTDDDNGEGVASTSVLVHNLDPVLEAGPDQEIAIGQTLQLYLTTIIDLGVEDTHLVDIDWGDGTSEPGTVAGSTGTWTVSGSHSYPVGGSYVVTITAVDDDNGFAEGSFSVLVIEDARFMTGGGNVSEGRGKNANRLSWGFVVRCDGTEANMQVNDHGSKSRFHLEAVESVSCWNDPAIEPGKPHSIFDSLALTGFGRWNGESGARIEITVTDAGEPGKGDSVEIRIWDVFGGLVETIPLTLTGGNNQAH